LGYKEIPDNWVKAASTLTEEEKKRLQILDNVSYGEWDFAVLDEHWDKELLSD
jgi:hypothetical protein